MAQTAKTLDEEWLGCENKPIEQRLAEYPRESFFIKNFRLADDLLREAAAEIRALKTYKRIADKRIDELMRENAILSGEEI